MLTKMILLDKFKDSAINPLDYVQANEVQDFSGTPLFKFNGSEYEEIGTVNSLVLNEDEETLTVNGGVSYYDDFDFDYVVKEDGTLEPFGVYVLEIDPTIEVIDDNGDNDNGEPTEPTDPDGEEEEPTDPTP